MNLGAEFRHLLSVARTAASRGDRRPAEVMFASYRAEAARAIAGFAVMAKEKARLMASVLASAPVTVEALPTPFDNPPPAFAVRQPRLKDPVSYMPLGKLEIRAVLEIRAIHEATTKALQPHAPPPDALKVDANTRDFDPWRFFTDELATARKTRYLPWVERNQKRPAVPSRVLSRADLALAVLVESKSLRQMEQTLEIGAGRLTEPFRATLRDYWR